MALSNAQKGLRMLFRQFEETSKKAEKLLKLIPPEKLDYQMLIKYQHSGNTAVRGLARDLALTVPTANIDFVVLENFKLSVNPDVRDLAGELALVKFPDQFTFDDLMHIARVSRLYGGEHMAALALSINKFPSMLSEEMLWHMHGMCHDCSKLCIAVRMQLMQRFPDGIERRMLERWANSPSEDVCNQARDLLKELPKEAECMSEANFMKKHFGISL